MSVLKGKKTIMRVMTAQDAEYLFSQQGQDLSTERLYDEIVLPHSLESKKKQIDEFVKEMETSDARYLLIEDTEGNIIGEIDAFDCHRRNLTFRVGFYIISNYRGQGYAKDAFETVLNFYFNEMNYQKCNNYIYSMNTTSIAFHEKIGFIKEGCVTRSYYTQGQYYDINYYGLTKEAFTLYQNKY